MTFCLGLHAVADIYCDCCKTTLGWKYEHAFESSQKYKEGKFIIELAHMIKVWHFTSQECFSVKIWLSAAIFNYREIPSLFLEKKYSKWCTSYFEWQKFFFLSTFALVLLVFVYSININSLQWLLTSFKLNRKTHSILVYHGNISE